MDDLSKLKVADLKGELKKRGLAVSGVKAALVERLQEAIDAETKSANAPKESKVEVSQADEIVIPVTEKIDGDSTLIGDESRGTQKVVETINDAKSSTPPPNQHPQTPASSTAPPPAKEMQQPPPTEITASISKEDTKGPIPPSPTKDSRSPTPLPENSQKPVEEVVSSNDPERKRKREDLGHTHVPDDSPFSPPKRAKPHSRSRSRTPEPSPHRVVAATQSPSIHPPTKSLYVTCLSRPLSQPAFVSHITSCTISKNPPTKMWLDAIKSHGFLTFDNQDDASAVRDTMNGLSWPPNENRKALSVDYIPSNVVSDWIAREEDSRGQRFEVVYATRNGRVEATHRVSQHRETQPVRLIDDKNDPEVRIPVGPRASRREDRAEGRATEKVRVLQPDELFRKTKTKPWIYWAEVETGVLPRRWER